MSKTSNEKATAKAQEAADAESKAFAALPVFTPPDVFGNEWLLMRPALRLRVKRVDEDIRVHGFVARAGEYVGVASDGGYVVLTEEELGQHYEYAQA